MSWEYYFKPIMAQGEAEKRPGTGELHSMVWEIPVDDATNYFDEGDPIFVTDGDGAGVSYLGLATAVTSTTVTCQLPTRRYYASYYVVTPTAYVIFGCDYSVYATDTDLGIENFRASGGTIYRTQVRDALGRYTMGFRNLDIANWVQVKSFIVGTINLGLEDFTLAYWDAEAEAQSVGRMRMLNESLDFITKKTFCKDFDLEFLVISADYY